MECPNCGFGCEETTACDDCGRDGCPDCILTIQPPFQFCQECRNEHEEQEKK